MGMKWSCTGFREPETKVYAEPDTAGLTDVRQFVQESTGSLALEGVDAEMEAVADTFRGVENLNGVFNWEGPDGSSVHYKHVKHYGNDHTYRVKIVLKDAEPEWINSSADKWVKRGESQHRRLLLSYLWKILPQKTSTKNSVELIEFARDLGNGNSTLQVQ